MTTRIFSPTDPEVRKFREKVFEEDLKLPKELITEITYENREQYPTFAYWYCDEKFLNSGLDQVLIYYWEGEQACLVAGTHYNKNLYRASQLYYILKKFNKVRGANTFPYKHDGQFQYQIARAKELGCKAVFVSVHTFDKRHERFWFAMKNDLALPGIMPIKDRMFSAKDFVFLDKEYQLMYVNQKIFYHDIYQAGIEFDELWNDS